MTAITRYSSPLLPYNITLKSIKHPSTILLGRFGWSFLGTRPSCTSCLLWGGSAAILGRDRLGLIASGRHDGIYWVVLGEARLLGRGRRGGLVVDTQQGARLLGCLGYGILHV